MFDVWRNSLQYKIVMAEFNYNNCSGVISSGDQLYFYNLFKGFVELNIIEDVASIAVPSPSSGDRRAYAVVTIGYTLYLDNEQLDESLTYTTEAFAISYPLHSCFIGGVMKSAIQYMNRLESAYLESVLYFWM